MMAATAAVYATMPREGGAGPHALNLTVATDTLPGTTAARYHVPATAPVVVRYTLVNSSEAGIQNLHVDDPDVPSAVISCAGGTALLPPLATRQCTATVPAADGSRVRAVRATGTLVWFGTPVSASASTGYVGYQAALTVHELVAGASTDPGKPDALAVGAPVQISYQITNTGDVPLSGLNLHSSLLNGAGCSSSGQALPPGGQVVCTLAPRAADGLHVDKVVASAAPQLTVVSGDGGLAAAPSVEASDQGAYVGVLASATSSGSAGGAGGAGGPGADRNGGPVAAHGARGSAKAPGIGSGNGANGNGNGGSTSSNPNLNPYPNANSYPNSNQNAAQQPPGLALDNGGGAPGTRSGAGFPMLLRRARHSLPWLMMIFLVVFVPVVVRLARANRSPER
jgi:hypothetical protein